MRKQWSRNMWEEVLLFLVPFRSQIFDAVIDFFFDLVKFALFNAISIDIYAVKSFICINFVVISMFISGRMHIVKI